MWFRNKTKILILKPNFSIVNIKLLKWQGQQVALIKIQKVTSSTYQFPPRSVLKRDHVEFLGCFPIHAIVFDPTGPKWSWPFNKAQIFVFFLMRRQTCIMGAHYCTVPPIKAQKCRG